MKIIIVLSMLCLLSLMSCYHSKVELTLKKGEAHCLNLESRANSGLQLLYIADKDSIVSVKCIANQPIDNILQGPDYFGSAVQTKFEIKAIAAGETKVTFYEFRPWDKNCKEVLVKQVLIAVR